MDTISLPTLDVSGDLTSFVLDAIEAKIATAELDPNDPQNTLLMRFNKAADAKAFMAKVAPILSAANVETDDVVAVDPATE